MSLYKDYLTVRVPKLLQELTPETRATFGVLTPQRMVEHLIQVSKSTAKDYGPPAEELTPSQEGFMRFVKKGAHFQYRHKDIKTEDLPHPRMANLEEAIALVPEAIARMYRFDRDHTFYNQMMGTLTFEEMELLHYKHYQHHLQRQFGLGL